MNIFSAIKTLNLPLGEYAVSGSGVLSAHGLRDFRDIDILISWKLFDDLKKRGWKERDNMWGSVVIENGIYEASPDIILAGTYHPNIQEIINNADIINNIAFLRLEDLLVFKRVLNRPKDLDDIRLITDFLAKKSSLG